MGRIDGTVDSWHRGLNRVVTGRPVSDISRDLDVLSRRAVYAVRKGEQVSVFCWGRAKEPVGNTPVANGHRVCGRTVRR